MDSTIQLYSFARSDASIYIARIVEVSLRPGQPGQQVVELRLSLEQTPWGETGAPIRRSVFTQPDNQTARLKFPDPVWGRVDPKKDARVFMVTRELGEAPAAPLYVEEIVEPNDPVLKDVSNILTQERLNREPQTRKARYLKYLAEGSTVEKLFGGEALAKDTDLTDVDQDGEIAIAMSAIVVSNESSYVRLSVGTWMWENIYTRTNPVGQIAIINATIKATETPSEDIQRLSLDYLTGIDPNDLRQSGVVSNPALLTRLEERLSLETGAKEQDQLQKIISALSE
ncbi:MAG TPA: hypothetical protein VHS05_15345 [Pyrinomonadaceae bacterium]|jgi:hypothetical protein|nr:hypothetical protein [Pyrinomonadaceae bacterium]